jgi:sarcosine oxidase subunit gamma
VPDRLTFVTPLDNFSAEINGISLREITGKAIVSIAVPRNGLAPLKTALKKAYKLDLPGPGQSTIAHAGTTRLVSTGPDQYFLIFDEPLVDAVSSVRKQIGGTGYLTCQSDSFAMLKVSGSRSREALERICQLDLEDGAFPVNMAQRTMMEHLGVLIIRESANSFILMSARSSAGSFLHAVETSATNI